MLIFFSPKLRDRSWNRKPGFEARVSGNPPYLFSTSVSIHTTRASFNISHYSILITNWSSSWNWLNEMDLLSFSSLSPLSPSHWPSTHVWGYLATWTNFVPCLVKLLTGLVESLLQLAESAPPALRLSLLPVHSYLFRCLHTLAVWTEEWHL